MRKTETPTPPRTILVDHEPIELCKLLKFGHLVDGGGQAKIVINTGRVRVNGEIETRKRRKITSDDLVEIEGDYLCIRVIEQKK